MRCPFRMRAFDKPDICDPTCAWLVTEDGCHYHAKMCAVTALAVQMGDGTLWAANFETEPKGAERCQGD